MPIKILFLCAKNQWRSPTAEQLYRKDSRCEVRSAGVSQQARRRVSAKDIDWADLVLVMEKNHRAKLQKLFPEECQEADIRILDIADDYPYMNPTLVDMLRDQIEVLLEA